MINRLTKSVAALGLAIGLATVAHAQDTLLTVTHQGESRSFDRAALAALGMEKIETTTIWTEGTQTFEGVPLHALAKEFDATDGIFRATAVNDYTIEIPLSDAVENGPILAMLKNGAQMSLRENGPLWVIYPYDTNADYRSELIYSRSIWQLDRIEIVE
jgi:hypothetical protein